MTNAPLGPRAQVTAVHKRVRPLQRTGILNVGDTALANCAYKKPKEVAAPPARGTHAYMSPTVTCTRRSPMPLPLPTPIKLSSRPATAAPRSSRSRSRSRSGSRAPTPLTPTPRPHARPDLPTPVGSARTSGRRRPSTAAPRPQTAAATPTPRPRLRLKQDVHQLSRSDLLDVRRAINLPHPSFDLDGDGVVSQEEYVLAKQLDTRGDGVLSARTLRRGRRALAQQFFERNSGHLWMFGAEYKGRQPAELADRLVQTAHFAEEYERLQQRERKLVNRSGLGVVGCMTLTPGALGLGRSRSRQELLRERKERDRREAEARIQTAWEKQPQYSLGRVAVLTDMRRENGSTF